MQVFTCLFRPSALKRSDPPILHQEAGVNDIDPVFKALADPSRRELLDRLHARNGQTLTELCRGLDMARQSVTQHLGLLEHANLVTVQRHGRERRHYFNPVPIHEIYVRWIHKFEQERLAALHDLKTDLERKSP
jgi:DNA-binding transcriptional ArsR family regulator